MDTTITHCKRPETWKRRAGSTKKPKSGYVTLSHTTPKHLEVGREATQRLLTLWKSGAYIRPSQMNYVWLWFDTYCLNVAAKHYKKTVKESRLSIEAAEELQNRHVDRILLSMEFFKQHPHRSIGWLISTYRIRFPLLEATLYLRALGVDVETDLRKQTVRTRDFMRLLSLCRKNYTYKGGIEPTALMTLYREQHAIADKKREGRVFQQCVELCQALSVYYPYKSIDDDNHLSVN
jgi:hypothetical protein